MDVQAIEKSQNRMGGLISATHTVQSKARVEHGFGHYAGIVEIGRGTLLATHTDGVGTKVMVANKLKKYDTIGIDCVAMNVNDIICAGATPISFVDYIAASANDEKKLAMIMRGLVRGAKKGAVPIVGGETAIMPDLFAGNDFAFDLAGTVVGLVPAKKGGGAILGDKVGSGDVIIGARSSGLHSNGYTLARAALGECDLDSRVYRGGPTIGQALLRPTEIYVRPVLEMVSSKYDLHGLAHITGGSFTKLLRLKRAGYEIDDLPPVPKIMRLVAEQGGIAADEMYRTFNMGVGFCVVAPEPSEDAIIKTFARHKIRSKRIGRIVAKEGVTVQSVRIA